jgi:hypothetical protein
MEDELTSKRFDDSQVASSVPFSVSTSAAASGYDWIIRQAT